MCIGDNDVSEGMCVWFLCVRTKGGCWLGERGSRELLLHMRKLRSFARLSSLIQRLYHGVVKYYFTLRIRGFYGKIFLIFDQKDYFSRDNF